MSKPNSPLTQEMFRRAVDAKMVPVHMTTYEQVKDYLQDKVGDKKWIGEYVKGLGYESGTKGYKAARRSIERYGETGKYGKQASDVGKQLPPIGKRLPGNSLTLEIKSTQVTSMKGGRSTGTRDRDFQITFTGADAHSFASNPNFRDFMEYNGGYDDDVIDMFEDGDYELDIYAIA